VTVATENLLKLVVRAFPAQMMRDTPIVALQSAAARVAQVITQPTSPATLAMVLQAYFQYVKASVAKLYVATAKMRELEVLSARGSREANVELLRLQRAVSAAAQKLVRLGNMLRPVTGGTSGMGVWYNPTTWFGAEPDSFRAYAQLFVAGAIVGPPFGGVAAVALYALWREITSSMDDVVEVLTSAEAAVTAICGPRGDASVCTPEERRRLMEQALAEARHQADQADWGLEIKETASTVVKVLLIGGAVLVGGYALFTFWPVIAGFTARTRGALKAREAAKMTSNRGRRRRRGRRSR
jgi:hypothetical protein